MNQSNPVNNPQTQPEQDFSTNVLFNRFLRALRSPVFEGDQEKTRKARMLNAILLTPLVAAILLMIYGLATGAVPGFRLVMVVFLQIVLVGGLVAIRRGHLNTTSILITFLIWTVVAIQSLLFGTAANPILPTMVLVVFMAGLIISSRAAVLYTILSLVFNGIVVVLSLNELITPVYEVTETNFGIQIGLNYLIMAVFVLIVNRNYREATRQMEDNRLAFLESESAREDLQTYLQQTVEENTRQLERRNKYLEAAARVAQSSISTLDLQEMLDTIVNQISEQLNFYHAGIFLVDDRREWAAMRAASSYGGKQMIARGHRLAVGKQGMVGFVTSIGQPRISQDTGTDRIHTAAPELPDTRAEMTLPLKSRDQIIGAIDIQDTNPNAFTTEDLSVLQTMADQVALAIENIRLFERAQESLEEIQRVYGEYSQQAWAETYRKNQLNSYRYIGGTVAPLMESDLVEESDGKISIPVSVRGIPIGNIEMTKDDDSKGWSNDELKLLQTVSEQLGIALDSARLFGESQLRANSEQLITEVSSHLWETMDINTILKNTAQKLRESLELPELTIRMTTPLAEESANGSAHLPEEESQN